MSCHQPLATCISELMARCRCLLALALVLAPAPQLAGQEALTLDRALSAALAQNASLRASRAGVDEAAARVTEARSGLFPRLSVTESWQRGNQPVFVFSSLLSARQFAAANFAIDALNHPDPIGFFRTSVGVEQRLFDGGWQRSVAAVAALRRDIANASTDEAAAAIALATTQTFGRLIAAQTLRRAADAALATAREDLNRAERRRDAGMATDADVLALVVHVADLQQRSIQSEGDAGIARAELNRLMGAPIERDVDVIQPSGVEWREVTEQRDVSVLLAEADAARPELRRTAAAERAADAGRQQARSALLPQVLAQAAFDISGTQIGDRASSWIVGGELRWTFSAGGAAAAGIKAATAATTRARAEADEARAAVHVDVVTALRRLQSAAAREAAGRAAVEQARESQRITRDRFDAGVASVNDVLRASAAVLGAEANRTAAFVDTLTAAEMLRRALGRRP
jgi:outer membrane protein